MALCELLEPLRLVVPAPFGPEHVDVLMLGQDLTVEARELLVSHAADHNDR